MYYKRNQGIFTLFILNQSEIRNVQLNLAEILVYLVYCIKSCTCTHSSVCTHLLYSSYYSVTRKEWEIFFVNYIWVIVYLQACVIQKRECWSSIKRRAALRVQRWNPMMIRICGSGILFGKSKLRNCEVLLVIS